MNNKLDDLEEENENEKLEDLNEDLINKLRKEKEINEDINKLKKMIQKIIQKESPFINIDKTYITEYVNKITKLDLSNQKY